MTKRLIKVLTAVAISIALAYIVDVNATNGPPVPGVYANPIPKYLQLCVKDNCECAGIGDARQCTPAYTETFIWRRPLPWEEIIDDQLKWKIGRCYGVPNDPYFPVPHECHVFDACFPEFTAWYGGRTFTTIPNVKRIEFGVEFYSEWEGRIVDDVQVYYVDKDEDGGWIWRWDQSPDYTEDYRSPWWDWPGSEALGQYPGPWWSLYKVFEEDDLLDYPGRNSELYPGNASPWDYHNGDSVIRVYFRKAGTERQYKAIQINIGGALCHRWFPSRFPHEIPEWGWGY